MLTSFMNHPCIEGCGGGVSVIPYPLYFFQFIPYPLFFSAFYPLSLIFFLIYPLSLIFSLIYPLSLIFHPIYPLSFIFFPIYPLSLTFFQSIPYPLFSIPIHPLYFPLVIPSFPHLSFTIYHWFIQIQANYLKYN